MLQREKLLEDREVLGLGIAEFRKNTSDSKLGHLIRGSGYEVLLSLYLCYLKN